MIVREIKGDLLDTDLKYIAHGVNCQNRMGSGVAKAIYSKYPEVKENYHKYYESSIYSAVNGQEDFLGTVLPVYIENERVVFNMFTQENYGYDGQKYVSYDAIKNCFEVLAGSNWCKAIAIPKIGCGLAGGDWNKVKDIINTATKDKIDVYVYYLE